MKNKINLIIAFSMIFIIGCDFSPTSSSEQISDSEIIEMIKNAEKIEISIDELPSQSRDIVQNEHIDYESFKNWRASGIGYLAELSGRGQNVGNFREVYFNMDGRKLDHNDREDEDRPDEDGEDERSECFELVLPVTYTMPDGSTITVETDDESSWSSLRSWYESNPDAEDEPSLGYPVDIMYGADSTVTINNQEEMENAYSSCRNEENEDRPEGDGDSGDSEDEERPEGDGEDVECFELILPVTYAMPDGSIITVEDDSGYGLLREWAENNPESDGEPSIQYPFDVLYIVEDQEVTVTINSNEEYMDSQTEYCSSDRD